MRNGFYDTPTEAVERVSLCDRTPASLGLPINTIDHGPETIVVVVVTRMLVVGRLECLRVPRKSKQDDEEINSQ